MMQIAKKIPFDDPTVLNLVRGVYVASNLAILGIYIYIQIRIEKKKGMHAQYCPGLCRQAS